jgi:hypothetical protein
MSFKPGTLLILQYNVWKICKGTNSLLADPKTQKHHVLAIQEPWKNTLLPTSLSGNKHGFYIAYRPEEDNPVAFYINDSTSKEDWEVEFVSRDLCTLRVRTRCPK